MTPNEFGVRRAVPADAGALTESAVHAFLDGALQTVSRDKVAKLVERCVQRERAIAGIIEGVAGTIVASIGMTVESFTYSNDEHLSVVWMGVHPEHRRDTHHARALMGFAQWAQSVLGVPAYLELSTTTELDGKMHLYQRLIPQVGARFSWGSLLAGQYNQARAGHDPLAERLRLRAAGRSHEPDALRIYTAAA